jgi:hypothetical protein
MSARAGMEFSPEGYMPPSALKRYEAPKGLNSWPAIFAYPGVCPPPPSSFRYHHSHTPTPTQRCAPRQEPPADHWPNVVSMILDNDGDLKYVSTGPSRSYRNNATAGDL